MLYPIILHLFMFVKNIQGIVSRRTDNEIQRETKTPFSHKQELIVYIWNIRPKQDQEKVILSGMHQIGKM